MKTQQPLPIIKKFLIVDNDEVAAQQCANILKPIADSVQLAGNGTQALRLCREAMPNLLVIAARLPDVSVTAWLKHLRQFLTTSRMPAVLLSTAFDDDKALTQEIAAEANDFIVKPYQSRELLLRVSRLLRISATTAHYDLAHLQDSRTTVEKTEYSAGSRNPAHTEEALRLNDERLQVIVNSTPIGICITNHVGIFEYVNPAYEKLYGYTREELIGQPFTLIVPEPYRQQLSTLHDQFIQGRAEVQGEWIVAGKDGQPFTILGNSALIAGADGQRKKVTFVIDISQRKQAEEDLKHAKLAAEQANQAKSEFMANISRELRNPLTSIIGLAEIMDGSPLNDQQQSWLNTVRKSSEQLLDMVNDLLDYAKIEAKRLEIENIVFSLPQLLAALKNVLQPLVDRVGLRLDLPSVTTVAALPQRLYGDPWRLQQVLLTLLCNGIRFTESGSVALRIEQQPCSNIAECQLVFTVMDTGIEIAPHTILQLFQPFFQEDSHLSRRQGGTGLGLAICQRLINLMEGEIKVHSERGVGNTFSFALRFKVAQNDSVAKTASVFLQGEQALHGRMILLVEGYPLNQNVIKLQLQSLGCVVHVAGDRNQALAMVCQYTYEAILMDIEGPLQGIEAAGDIRHRETAEGRSPVPIIALTAYSQASERQRCQAAGINDYLIKPLRKQTLSTMLRRWLQEAVVDNDEPKSLPASLLNRIDDPEAEIRESLKQLVEDLQPSGAVTVLKTTLIHVPKQLDGLLTALAEQDWETASRAAHKLKGTAKLYGSKRLTRLLLQAEQKSSLESEVGTLAVELAGEYELAMRQVKQLIKRLEMQISKN